QELTDDEIKFLRHYALKVETHMTLETFKALPHAFPNSKIQSWKVTKARAAWLAQFTPVPYDCCVNSCCCFVGPHVNESHCPYCNESRYFTGTKRPRKRFTYIPLIPRLTSFYKSPSMVHKMKYRDDYSVSNTRMRDIYDGQLYKNLREKHVTVGDTTFPHKFFQHPRDIALGLSTDGFAPWRRRTKTC
ncbi:hypothetical protein K435DRAFT_584855, partial [Dendrothele bispora CBS 962.96]